MTDRVRRAFDSVRAEEKLKENTVRFMEEQQKAHQLKSRFSYGCYHGLAAVTACFILIFGSGGGWFYLTPVSAITVDINPSIELGINRLDRVVSVEGYNEEGAALVAGLHVKNMNYTAAIDEILSNPVVVKFLEEDELMEVTIVGTDESKSRQMLSRVEECTSHALHHSNVSCHTGDAGEVEKAREAGLPLGKYRAFLELKELDPDTTAEDIQGLTMRQIRNCIKALESGRDGMAQEESDKESGDSTETVSGSESGNKCENGQSHGHGHGHK